MNGYSTQLGEKLRKRLFRRDDTDFNAGKAEHVSYFVLHNCMDDALATWAVHGVCLHCQQWSISDGRCPECGRIYSERHVAMWHQVDAQIRRAQELLR